MGQATPLVIFGAAGRMGRLILQLAAAAPARFRIIGAVDHDQHPWLNQRLDQFIPGGPREVTLKSLPPDAPPAGTVAVHFSTPEATLRHLPWSRQHGVATLIGTTGLAADQMHEIEALAREVAVLVAANTSRGVNVLYWLVHEAARLLGADYEIEIVEMHHHHKVDAPSGTARRLAESALEVRGGDYAADVVHGRRGITGERRPGEIGMHALRGGDVVGDHTVVLAGAGERLELTHRAHTREVLARGAIDAAAWLSGRAPGLSTMKDVLGL